MYSLLGDTMLTATVLVCLWSAVYVSAEDSQSQCASSSSMTITFRTQRNQSGHWRSMVSFKQSEETSIADRATEQWAVDVDQRSYVCEQNKATLETTLYLTAPPPSTTSSPWTQPSQVVAPNVKILPPQVKGIHPGYIHFVGIGYYNFHHDVTNWNVARDRCIAEGGHLIVINSDAEAEVVKTLFDMNPNSPGSAYNSNVLVGVHKVGELWSTVLGDEMGSATTPYAKWSPGEPNYSDTCVAALRPTVFYNNVDCSSLSLAYICEIELL